MEQTWDGFKKKITVDHRLYRNQTHKAQASGFHVANHAQQAGVSNSIEETSEALAMLATASSAHRGTMATPISTNAGLSSRLAEKISALSEANEFIIRLRAAARNNGGGGAAASIGSSSSSGAEQSSKNNRGNGRNPPITDNYNYCWSRGHQIHADHTSLTCTRCIDGNKEQATMNNTRGGHQWGRATV
jgi:hypothetical protein